MTVRGVGGAGQTVTYDAPTTGGGVAPVTVTCAPASGSLFTIGTTPVGCTASDSQARRAQCAFSVTLTPQLLSVTKFVAFGDSFTEGQNGLPDPYDQTFIDLPNSYPTKLESLLNSEYPGQGIVVLNRGLGGEPVGSGVVRLREVVLPADRPDALLLLDGYNDLGACPGPSCAGTINEVVKKLRECIQTARTTYAVRYVFVSTLTPPGPFLGGVNDRRRQLDAIVQTNASIRSMAPAEGAILVDPFPLFIGHEAEYVDSDGLHLRPAGYQVLAETFFAAIKATITTTPGFNRSIGP